RLTVAPIELQVEKAVVPHVPAEQAPAPGFVAASMRSAWPAKGPGSATFALVRGCGLELAVILDTDLVDQVDLRLKEVDVAFLVFQEVLEELHGNVVLVGVADVARARVKRLRVILTREI